MVFLKIGLWFILCLQLPKNQGKYGANHKKEPPNLQSLKIRVECTNYALVICHFKGVDGYLL